MKKILVVSLVVIVALLSALPAVAMITEGYGLYSNAGRASDDSFGNSGKAEYCKKSGHPDCDDDDDDGKDDDKDDDKDEDKDKDDKDKDKDRDDKDDKDRDKGKNKGKDKDRD